MFGCRLEIISVSCGTPNVSLIIHFSVFIKLCSLCKGIFQNTEFYGLPIATKYATIGQVSKVEKFVIQCSSFVNNDHSSFLCSDGFPFVEGIDEMEFKALRKSSQRLQML